jgi:protein-L-isoaspartate(D-aspartate) O-methyltransferase
MLIALFTCLFSLVFLFPSWFAQAKPSPPAMDNNPNLFSQERRIMVEQQLQLRGISSPSVLEAMSKVPRHNFVPSHLAHLAYVDSPLPLDYGQTISQPFIVAYMTELAQIKPEDQILEIGTGSGYQTAVLAELAHEVYSIEIIPELTHTAGQILSQLGYHNIHFKIGNGYEGWRKYAPYNSILVTAAPEKIPTALVEQLALNGKMIIPVGKYYQQIVVITKTAHGLTKQKALPVRFVPMISPN